MIMPVDTKRYDVFAEEMAALMRGLSAHEQLAIVQAKMIDYLSKRNLGLGDLAEVRQLSETLLGEELTPFIDRVFRRYAGVLEVVNELYSDLGVEISRDVPRIYAIERANARELGDYEDAMAREITRNVRESMIAKESATELEERIRRIGDKAEVYAQAIAQTQLKVVGRVAKGEKARIAEVVFFEYVGTLRDSTRPFCRALLGSTHHIDTIRQMHNGNKNPVFENCGGWRCIHDWEPDPFATEASAGDIVQIEEGSQTVALAGGAEAAQEYEKAKELNKKATKK